MIPRVLSLFSGIGGFDLAAQWAGMETVAFCEIEPFCRAVLAKHWPEVPCFEDVRQITVDDLLRLGRIDVIVGGFPCQDLSVAGKGAGLEGERSGLWFEYLRIIKIVRPAFCLIENVPGLRTRGIDRVLEGLEEAGYSAESFVVGADDIGATHRRKRVWIVAHSQCAGLAPVKQGELQQTGVSTSAITAASSNHVVDAEGEQNRRKRVWIVAHSRHRAGWAVNEIAAGRDGGRQREPFANAADNAGSNVAYTENRGARLSCGTAPEITESVRNVRNVANGDGQGLERRGLSECECGDERAARPSNPTLPLFPPGRTDFRGWASVASVDPSLMPCVEREVLGVATRLPAGLVRRRGRARNAALKAYGNAVVPQVAYPFLVWIKQQLEGGE